MASVFLYVPNIIGYIRMVCILACWIYFDDFRILIPIYLFQAALDGVDGSVARCLNQCSSFGAWWGVFVTCFEWAVFVCTHTLGMKWREAFGTAPNWVQRVMEKGFHTPIGAYAIIGLHGLPLYLYVYQKSGSIPFVGSLGSALLIPIILLAPGRMLCSAVESWFIYIHIKMMNQMDAEAETEAETEADET